MINGEYKFKIWQEDGWYLAKCEFDGQVYYTQDETEEEIFEMVADLFLTIHGISISRWSKFWHKFLKIN